MAGKLLDKKVDSLGGRNNSHSPKSPVSGSSPSNNFTSSPVITTSPTSTSGDPKSGLAKKVTLLFAFYVRLCYTFSCTSH